MSNHTPLPWSFTSEDCNPEYGSFYIRDSHGQPMIWLGASTRWKPSENHANAEFITRACNNHYIMLESLEIALEVIDATGPGNYPQAERKIKKAIAKAKGEAQWA